MTKYEGTFVMDGGNDTFTIEVLIESAFDLDKTISLVADALHTSEFFTAERNPDYYCSNRSERVIIRNSKVIDVIVRERV